MEAQLTNTELICKVPNTELTRAWHLLALLLRIGHPASPIELACRCNLFHAPPDFVEYLCSIPNSPLLLTGDLFVVPSLIAVIAFVKFWPHLNLIEAFAPRIGFRVISQKRKWEDAVQTYCRRRKRLKMDLECLPMVQNRALLHTTNGNKEGDLPLALPERIQNAFSEKITRLSGSSISPFMQVNSHIINEKTSSINVEPGDTSAESANSRIPKEVMIGTSLLINSEAGLVSYGINSKPGRRGDVDMSMRNKGQKYVCSSKYQHGFFSSERFLCNSNPITAEKGTACMPCLESSLLINVTENQSVSREVKMNDFNSTSKININATSCLEMDKLTITLQVEAEKVQSCNDTNIRPCEERLAEGCKKDLLDDCDCQKRDIASIFPQIDSTKTDLLPKGEFRRISTVKCDDVIPYLDRRNLHMESSATLSAATPSHGEKLLTKPPAELEPVRKDALSPRYRALQKMPEKSEAVCAIAEQQQSKKDKRSISMKLKGKQNYGQHMHAKENRGSSKWKREQSPFTILNAKPKVLPNFESFVVEEEEGSGGYGTVYKVHRKSDGVTFAIKCPHANANRHHVHNEVKMLERFGGKNFVIKYEGSFKSGNSDCLVLEHVQHDRPEVLKREIDVFQLRWYSYCMFRALAGLHKQGIVHRDVKPGNFLFSRKVNKGYLIDFNLAMDLHQKYGATDKSKVDHDVSFDHSPLPHAKSLLPNKSRKLLAVKPSEAVNQGAGKNSRSLLLRKNMKKKATNQTNVLMDINDRNKIKSQGADGSGITSAKDATSVRTASAERLREPMPSHGRKELISLVQEALHGPNHEAFSISSSKRKRVAAFPGRLDRKLVYLTPMPLHCSGIAVAGAGLSVNKGGEKHKREGPCVGTKGFRAPEVLFRSPHQGPKVDIWSAGVSLLYLMIGKTPFVGDPEQNIKEIAKLRGNEELWEVAKLHNCESSFPADLFDVQSLPYMKLRDWCELNTKRPDFLEVIPRSLFDLVDKCLKVNPRLRINAEEALRHEFFTPCHESLRKQRLLRQGLSLDSTTASIHGHSQTPEGSQEHHQSAL